MRATILAVLMLMVTIGVNAQGERELEFGGGLHLWNLVQHFDFSDFPTGPTVDLTWVRWRERWGAAFGVFGVLSRVDVREGNYTVERRLPVYGHVAVRYRFRPRPQRQRLVGRRWDPLDHFLGAQPSAHLGFGARLLDDGPEPGGRRGQACSRDADRAHGGSGHAPSVEAGEGPGWRSGCAALLPADAATGGVRRLGFLIRRAEPSGATMDSERPSRGILKLMARTVWQSAGDL